jgi:hypothetical protein
MMKKCFLLFCLLIVFAVARMSYISAQLPGTSISNGSGAPSSSCVSGSAYIDSATGYHWTCKGGAWILMSSGAPISCTTGSIGGSLLLAGASASGTATCTGATTSMVCDTQASDGTNMAALGATPACTVTSANTVTVNVVAIIGLTPASKTYSVRVIP